MASKARAQANLLGADGKIKATQFGNDTITSDMLAPNLELTGDYVKVPVGTTAERPGSPAVGHLRFNTTFGRLEQYVSDGWQAVDTPPTVTALAYSGGLLGADPAGGETVTITGTNFQSGANVTFGDTAAASVTVNSSTSITATTPAKTAGDYDVVVTNSNGLNATLQNGISYNGLPAFTTPAGQIGNDLAPSTTISTITIVAAEPDGGTLSYSITSGAVPTGLTFDSDGTIDGTTPDLSSTTTYNFTVTATDDENQTNSRAFNLVVLRKIYAYSIPQSLMFNDDDNQYLSWTAGTPTDRKKFTFSCWVKRGLVNTTAEKGLFAAGTDNSNHTNFGFGTDTDTLQFQHRPGDASGGHVFYRSTARYSDPSAWYHIVLTIDTTQASASDRIKVYVNGVQDTTFVLQSGKDEIQLNEEFEINQSGKLHTVGARKITSIDSFHDGYMTEVHFIDGQALTYTSFAESYNDVWVPKDYTGSYGTNGFHLPMTNDTSVEAFNTITWRGDGSGTLRPRTGVGFSPDLVWIKNRGGANHHILFDSVRGTGSNKELSPNTTSTEGGLSLSQYDWLSSFDSDGFSTQWSGSNIPYYTNQNGSGYVAWCWKAGDSNVSNTDGSITSTVRANQTYGFSIVSYTGNNTNGATVGHGLSSTPEMLIIKARNTTTGWSVNHVGVGMTSGYLQLQSDAAFSSANNNVTGVSSSTFTLGVDSWVNASSQPFICYAFHSVTNYSKFGSYTGNGSTTGPIITTGFKPALVILKPSSAVDHWNMYDNTRDTTNPTNALLFPNRSNAEGTGQDIEITDTGFQLKNDNAGSNGNGTTYIYAAFADTRDYAFWRDESGNNNDWQPVNTGAYRVTTDTPTE